MSENQIIAKAAKNNHKSFLKSNPVLAREYQHDTIKALVHSQTPNWGSLGVKVIKI